jgi:Transposase DDE domain/Transposase DNA-binding
LKQRLEALVELAGLDPSASIPKMTRTESEREAAYRFLANERVTFDAVLQPHLEQTRERAAASRVILAVHDTSTFKLEGSRGRALGHINTGARGFFLHATLAVGNTEQRECLGVLQATTLFRESLRKTKEKMLSGAACAALQDRESERWWKHVATVEERLDDRCEVIHVADCEADSYTLLSKMVQAQYRFVTRMARDRRARPDSNEAWSLVSRLAGAAEHVAEREVPLSARTNRRPPRTLKRFPAREARVAKLRFAAMPLKLKRPPYLDDTYPPDIEVNVVRVYEVDAPDGTEAVEWFLFTTEPTRTKQEVLAIVDIYRRRWVIEEFFRAVKTGCAYEQRQLESRHAWLTILAITLPLAWRLLQLRHFARTAPDAPAATVLTQTEIDVLKHLRPQKLSAKPTVLEAMLVVAEMGGHIKNNGDPGWLVLHRGMSKLQALAEGVELARQMQPSGP